MNSGIADGILRNLLKDINTSSKEKPQLSNEGSKQQLDNKHTQPCLTMYTFSMKYIILLICNTSNNFKDRCTS